MTKIKTYVKDKPGNTLLSEFLENNYTECLKDTSICSPVNLVKKMRNHLIDKGLINKDGNLNPEEIINKMKEVTGCSTEKCAAKHIAETRELIEHFKPDGPSTETGLLSNYDIDHFLDHLATTHSEFNHIPFQMADFDETNSDLLKLDLEKLLEDKKTKFGVVFNTDLSTGGGKHWFCLYGEYDEEENTYAIEYFNSSGKDPIHSVNVFLHNLKERTEKNTNIKVSLIKHTGVVYQNDNHSCGVYCLMFIWLRTIGFIKKDNVNVSDFNDDNMLKAREILFTKPQ